MSEYAIFMDGVSFCAVRPDYINLQESLAGFGNTPELAKIHLLEQELFSACEERDRFRKDAEALDWCIAHGYCPWGSDLDDQKDMPEHLRKRLEGSK